MRLNMTAKLLKSVQNVNDDVKSLSRKALKETTELNKNGRKCPRCGNIMLGYPAISRFDNVTEICSDCGTEESLENMMGGYITNPNTKERVSLKDLKVMKALEDDELEDNMNESADGLTEEVTVDNPTSEDLEADDENTKAINKKEIEDRIGQLRIAIQDGVPKDEREAMEKEIAELEDSLLESSNKDEHSSEDTLKESVDWTSNPIWNKVINTLDSAIYSMEKEEAIALLEQIKKDCDVFINSLK